MLNFFLKKKVIVKFSLFYIFFTNCLSQKVFCVPSVSRRGWNMSGFGWSGRGERAVVLISLVILLGEFLIVCYDFSHGFHSPLGG